MNPQLPTPTPSFEISDVVMADGSAAASLVSLHAGGLVASVLSYGAALVSFEAPDRAGHLANCVVTLADPGDLADPALNPHLGGIVGPYANRIAGAAFDLDGVHVRLEANEGPNTLHSGSATWDRRRWDIASMSADATSAQLSLTLIDADGSGGFPGRVEVTATYVLHEDGTLTLNVEYTCDRPTVVAPTSHTYWNLGAAGTVAGQRLTLRADTVLELGAGQIPTGAALPVAGSAWDLRDDVRLRDRLGLDALADTGGYDHTYLVGGACGSDLSVVAMLVDPASGRSLEMRTNQPAVHLYTGNHLGGQPGPPGPIPQHGGVCLEAGQVPNGPNLTAIDGPDGPIPVDVTIRPGETRRWVTSWRLGFEASPAQVPPG
ncbi:aldose epimerase family protein [Candidatus Neomicrothrix sp.]|jgi:aldose 1-epimerase|uniref:aldose epimerase family protein n=1 Tax=Candidatus Neomicrothrix sp. TaxID=2719034 RepID=UPI001B539BEF|nr:aldose epimerase family protein [Candidatus Microthrix sp.]MBP6148673.1 galactose mutarotase [Candidatus Microthrix sp.]